MTVVSTPALPYLLMYWVTRECLLVGNPCYTYSVIIGNNNYSTINEITIIVTSKLL